MFNARIFQALFIVFLLGFLGNPAPVFASRPGGGPEGPDVCTVMGVVTDIKDGNKAVVRLKETSGSSTQMGCQVTGAQAMADKNTPVIVPLNVQPQPTITAGDVVFVDVRSGEDVALQTWASGDFTLNQLLGDVQVHFDNRLERMQMIYAIKCFLGEQHVVDELAPRLIEDDKEKRLSAALMLIALADAKLPVPPEALQQALRIGLLESRQTLVGNSIRLYPGDRAQIVNLLIGLLHDPEVVDPFATIVAIGEMGEEGQRAIPDAIDRLNETGLSQLRGDGDKIFAEAVEKTKSQDKAVKLFMERVNDMKLKDKEGPLAKGMCMIKVNARTDLDSWCKNVDIMPLNCKDAEANLERFIAARPTTCTKDDDCGGYSFPTAGPECPPAYFLAKSGMTEEDSVKATKLQAILHAACAKERGPAIPCTPPVWHPGCREGKCVDLK